MIQHDRVEPRFPRGMRTVGRVPLWLLRSGVPMGPLRLLETTGHRTGRTRVVPVVLLTHGGRRWLVSPFGETGWLRNHRAGSPVRIGRGRRLAEVALDPAPAEDVPHLLRTYRRRFAAVPFVRAAFTATGSDPVEAFAAEAADHPVLEVVDPR